MANFLRTKNTEIILNDKTPVQLRGVNLGGWLMMEAYILHAPNYPERRFRAGFRETLGQEALDEFDAAFRGAFIQASDIEAIAQIGFNCIRVPFHYRLVEKAPYQYDAEGAGYLDRVIQWAKANNIWVILDLHAAPGAQNHDWHSDSAHEAELWTNEENRKRTYALWEFIADRYKDEETVAGYDLLNESVLDDAQLLNKFYKEVIKSIRKVDKNHILFIEGNKWATDIDCLDEFDDDNYALSIHSYEPIDFTFSFIPLLSYPLNESRGGWNKDVIRRHLTRYKELSQKRKLPVLVGEFGINARNGLFGEDVYLSDVLDCFRDFGFHWTYWTYKAVKGGSFPDGIYSYFKNPVWVSRVGPLMGWDTYKFHWPKHKKEMIESWMTDQFEPNKEVIKVIKNAVR